MESLYLRETLSFLKSRNPQVCSQTKIRIPAPCFRGDKFREDDI